MTGGSIDGGGGGRGRGRDLLSADALRRAKENLEHQSAAIDSLTQAEREGEGERERERERQRERERERGELGAPGHCNRLACAARRPVLGTCSRLSASRVSI